MQQQKDTDAFYADKEAGEEQAARQTTLRLETRANVQAGNFDALPNLFVQYVENGGDVKYFTRWYKDAMGSALETRSERRLTDLMKNDRKLRSEEHTSELQSLIRTSYAVCCLIKKKKQHT